MTPPGALGDTDTRVLLALQAGARSIPALRAATSKPHSTVYSALRRLRRHGLVTWQDGRQGTLRAQSIASQPCSANVRWDNEGGQGAVGAAPGRGRTLQRGDDMAGHYPDAAAPDQGGA